MRGSFLSGSFPEPDGVGGSVPVVLGAKTHADILRVFLFFCGTLELFEKRSRNGLKWKYQYGIRDCYQNKTVEVYGWPESRDSPSNNRRDIAGCHGNNLSEPLSVPLNIPKSYRLIYGYTA